MTDKQQQKQHGSRAEAIRRLRAMERQRSVRSVEGETETAFAMARQESWRKLQARRRSLFDESDESSQTSTSETYSEYSNSGSSQSSTEATSVVKLTRQQSLTFARSVGLARQKSEAQLSRQRSVRKLAARRRTLMMEGATE